MDTDNKGKGVDIKERSASECDSISNGFPAGLRVLVVDDDRTCLAILEKMLRTCLYQVTKCRQAKDALSMLREDESRFDIVVSDLHMPDMDGFKLLELIGLEMDLPVVMMSADDGYDVILKGIVHGACDYLIKPIRMDALKIIWQHVLRKKKNAPKELEQPRSVEDDKPQRKSDGAEIVQSKNTESLKRRKDDHESEGGELVEASDAPRGKKRLVWSKELHEKFVMAVNLLGPGNVVPAKILDMMQKMDNVPTITRENVASHLQKYRKLLRDLDEIQPQNIERFASAGLTRTSIFQQNALADRRQLQRAAATNQCLKQSLTTNQRIRPSVSIASSSNGMHFNEQSNLPLYRMAESSYSPASMKPCPSDFPNNNSSVSNPSWRIGSSAHTPFPPFGGPHPNPMTLMHPIGSQAHVTRLDCEDYVYGNQESIDQHSRNFPVGNSGKISNDATHQLIYQPSFPFQYLDQNDYLQGLLEHDALQNELCDRDWTSTK